VENPSLEFDYLLAETLGMSVARMRRELSGQEYQEWIVYFGRKAQRRELAEKVARG
jgi:hypothetical protein